MRSTKLTGDMSGNRFENDLIARWGRFAVYRTDVGGLMTKYSGSIISVLFAFWTLEIDLVGRKTRGLGELVKEFGIGFSIGKDNDPPKCSDIRILFLWWSFLRRFKKEWIFSHTHTLPLVSRVAIIQFLDVGEAENCIVFPSLHMDTYVGNDGTHQLYRLTIEIDSKVMAYNRTTGEEVRLNRVEADLLKVDADTISRTIEKALTFHSRRLILTTGNGSLSKAIKSSY